MAAEKRRKKDAGYHIAVTGMKGIVRILIWICLIVVIIFLAGKAYAIGYAAFNEQPVDTGEGRTVNVTITEEMSVYDIGKMLKAEGVINEDPDVFWVQEMISDYHGKLLPGTYELKTSMTTEDIFPILAQAADPEDMAE